MAEWARSTVKSVNDWLVGRGPKNPEAIRALIERGYAAQGPGGPGGAVVEVPGLSATARQLLPSGALQMEELQGRNFKRAEVIEAVELAARLLALRRHNRAAYRRVQEHVTFLLDLLGPEEEPPAGHAAHN